MFPNRPGPAKPAEPPPKPLAQAPEGKVPSNRLRQQTERTRAVEAERDAFRTQFETQQAEIRKLAQTGPTEEELTKAKSFLKGSYALRFDTSTKIAEQLVQIQLDDLGIDYIDKRNAMVEAVTMADVKRVAKRLLDAKMLVTVVGKPQPLPAKGG